MNSISTIPKLVSVEFKKSRHKHSFLLLAIAVLLNYFFLFRGNSPNRQAWYNVFYAIPLTSSARKVLPIRENGILPTYPSLTPIRITIPICKRQNKVKCMNP